MLLQHAKTAVQGILLACLTIGLLSAQGLTITSSPTLPPASAAVSYFPITLTATGGSPPYTWTVLGLGLTGLPMGMTLSAAGVISGTPGSVGAYSPQIRVTDNAGTIQTQQFSLTVAPGGTLISHAGVIAQVAAGLGWDTTIYLINTSASQYNSASITFRGDNGAAMFLGVSTTQLNYSESIIASSLVFTLNPASTLVVHTTAPAAAALQQGWADIAATTGIASYAIFRQTLSNGVVAEGTSAQQSNFQSSLIVPFDNTANNVSTAGVVSLASAPVTITATIWDQNGVQIGAQFILPPLPPAGHAAFSIPAQFPGTAGKQGFIRFDNSTPDFLSGIGFSFGSAFGGAFTSVPTLPVAPM